MFNHVPFTSRATTTICADFSSFFLGQRSNSLSPIASPHLATSNVVNLFETMDDVSRSDDVASRARCSANHHAVALCHCFPVVYRVVSKWNMPDNDSVMAKTVNGFKTKLERERAKKMGLFLDWCPLGLGAVTEFRSGRPASILQVLTATPIMTMEFLKTWCHLMSSRL